MAGVLYKHRAGVVGPWFRALAQRRQALSHVTYHRGVTVELRAYREEDRGHFVALFGDAEVSGFVGGPKPPDAASALFDSLVDGSHARAIAAFAACTADGMVGHAVLFGHDRADTVELGYMIERASWGRGLGTQVALALLDEARARDFRVALGSVDLDNAPSRRILEKIGGVGHLQRDDEGEFMEYRIAL